CEFFDGGWIVAQPLGFRPEPCVLGPLPCNRAAERIVLPASAHHRKQSLIAHQHVRENRGHQDDEQQAGNAPHGSAASSDRLSSRVSRRVLVGLHDDEQYNNFGVQVQTKLVVGRQSLVISRVVGQQILVVGRRRGKISQ